MNDTQHAPDGRFVFHWRGKDRKQETSDLAEAIIAAVDGLCNHSGAIARLNGNGDLDAINLAAFHELISKNLCGVRVVPNGSGWQREYFSYKFDPPPLPDMAHGGRRVPDNSLPDANVLDVIFRTELVWRLPKVKE
jgi:hypothetical protein